MNEPHHLRSADKPFRLRGRDAFTVEQTGTGGDR